MKKILVFIVIVISFLSMSSFAAPIVELAAPRVQAPKIISDDTQNSSINTVKTNVSPKNNEKKPTAKQPAKPKYKKTPLVKTDYNKVSKLIEYGYYDSADSILKSTINRNPKDIEARALLIISLAKQYKLDPAQADLSPLLKKYPNNSNLHYAQGLIYYQRTASSNMFYRGNSQKLINDAMREFVKAVELDKKNAKAYNAAGVTAIKLNKNKEAADYFQKALNIDKTYSMAIDNLGTLDFADAKFIEAQKKFEQALVYNTQNTTAMYHLAQTAIQKQDYAAALTHLNNALAINSNLPAVYNLMGKAYLAQGNEAAAVNAFKQSIATKPEFTLSYADLANIYQQRGDYELALVQLRTALSIQPDFYDSKLKMADILLNCGKYTQAIDVYSELAGVEGFNLQALVGLANAYYGQAQVSSFKALTGSNQNLFNALDSINKALELNKQAGKQDLSLYLAKLKLSKLANQPDEPRVVLENNIKSQSSDLISAIIKGESYLALGDYLNAQKTFDSAINLSDTPSDDLALSEIFIFYKQYDNAEKALNKVLKNNPQNKQALSEFDYIQKSKKYAKNYFDSAKTFLKSRNFTMAIEYLTRSLTFNPNNPQAHLILAQLYEKQKDYSNALINYQAYLGQETNASDLKKIRQKIEVLDNKL